MKKTLISRTAKGQAVEMLVKRMKEKNVIVKTEPVTALMPTDFLKTVDALAKAAHMSRSKMMVELIKIGVGEAMAELDDDAKKLLGKEGEHTC